jgi:hypothetical protein
MASLNVTIDSNEFRRFNILVERKFSSRKPREWRETSTMSVLGWKWFRSCSYVVVVVAGAMCAPGARWVASLVASMLPQPVTKFHPG